MHLDIKTFDPCFHSPQLVLNLLYIQSHHNLNYIAFALIAKPQITLTFLYSTWFDSRFLLHSFLLPSLRMLLLYLFRLARGSQTNICRHLSEYIFHSCRFLYGIWLWYIVVAHTQDHPVHLHPVHLRLPWVYVAITIFYSSIYLTILVGPPSLSWVKYFHLYCFLFGIWLWYIVVDTHTQSLEDHHHPWVYV